MGYFVEESVEGKGIKKLKEFPRNLRYFTQLDAPEIICIPEEKPAAEKLLSILIEPEIISARFINTNSAEAQDGFKSSGFCAIVNIRLRHVIKYAAKEQGLGIHVFFTDNFIEGAAVVLPERIGDTPLEKLVEQSSLRIEAYMQDISAGLRNERTIFRNALVLVCVKHKNLRQ